MRKIPRDSKIAVAMSGGVDSGVAVSLLVDRGYNVIGVFMRHLDNIDESMEAARKTAGKLEIPFYTVDYRQDFKEIVVDYFLSEYRAGKTPNPCVVCNKFIKFGKLLDYARGLGCDYLAMGHYARIEKTKPAEEKPLGFLFSTLRVGESAGRYKLLMGVDKSKDQSYFLWQLSQKQLGQILFPVGGLIKEEVKKIASEKNLPVAKRPESFEICFIPDSLEKFLRRQIPEEIKPGPVVDTAGSVIGKHQGLPLYTYGQRRGFELEKYQGIPLYVVGIDKEKNALIVGRGAESEVREFEVEDVNWIVPDNGRQTTDDGLKCLVRIRHQGELLPGIVKLLNGWMAGVVLGEPTRAVTPGQSAVFYDGEELLGGGIISGFKA